MHLFENAIINDVFATLRSYNYNIENQNLKVLIDTYSVDKGDNWIYLVYRKRIVYN